MVEKLVDMNRHLRITILYIGFMLSIGIMLFSDQLWFLFFVLGFTFLGVLIYTNIQYDKKLSLSLDSTLEKALKNYSFQADDSYLSDDYLSGIAMNESLNKIAILKRNNINEDFQLTQFDFSDIVEVSVVEDGETLTKSSKSSVIGGSLVGSVVAGSAGMIVGGLSGKKHSKEQIIKATLSIVVDDMSNPIRNVHFLNSKMLIDKNSDLYQSIHDEMNKWYKRLSIVIKRNEK